MAEIDAPPLETLAIVGLGLIGSSIARGARHYGLARHIVAIDRDAGVLERVRALNLADTVTDDIATGVGGADLVILCVPVGTVGAVAALMGPHLKAGAIVSDVGSVKASVLAASASPKALTRSITSASRSTATIVSASP